MQRREARRIAVHLALMALSKRCALITTSFTADGRNLVHTQSSILDPPSAVPILPRSEPTPRQRCGLMKVDEGGSPGRTRSHLAPGRSMVPNYISNPRTLLSIKSLPMAEVQIRGPGRTIP